MGRPLLFLIFQHYFGAFRDNFVGVDVRALAGVCRLWRFVVLYRQVPRGQSGYPAKTGPELMRIISSRPRYKFTFCGVYVERFQACHRFRFDRSYADDEEEEYIGLGVSQMARSDFGGSVDVV
jgi:hypothetical protein